VRQVGYLQELGCTGFTLFRFPRLVITENVEICLHYSNEILQ